MLRNGLKLKQMRHRPFIRWTWFSLNTVVLHASVFSFPFDKKQRTIYFTIERKDNRVDGSPTLEETNGILEKKGLPIVNNN